MELRVSGCALRDGEDCAVSLYLYESGSQAGIEDGSEDRQTWDRPISSCLEDMEIDSPILPPRERVSVHEAVAAAISLNGIAAWRMSIGTCKDSPMPMPAMTVRPSCRPREKGYLKHVKKSRKPRPPRK